MLYPGSEMIRIRPESHPASASSRESTGEHLAAAPAAAPGAAPADESKSSAKANWNETLQDLNRNPFFSMKHCQDVGLEWTAGVVAAMVVQIVRIQASDNTLQKSPDLLQKSQDEQPIDEMLAFRLSQVAVS